MRAERAERERAAQHLVAVADAAVAVADALLEEVADTAIFD